MKLLILILGAYSHLEILNEGVLKTWASKEYDNA